MLGGCGGFAIAGVIFLGHQFGRPRLFDEAFILLWLVFGLIAILLGLMTVELRTDPGGLHWRHFGMRRSLAWSQIEGFGVWRDRSVDEYNNHPLVQITRGQRPRPPAHLMIRLTPDARDARHKPWLFRRSGYDIGLNLPFRMSLMMLTDRLEQRLATARAPDSIR